MKSAYMQISNIRRSMHRSTNIRSSIQHNLLNLTVNKLPVLSLNHTHPPAGWRRQTGVLARPLISRLEYARIGT